MLGLISVMFSMETRAESSFSSLEMVISEGKM